MAAATTTEAATYRYMREVRVSGITQRATPDHCCCHLQVRCIEEKCHLKITP